MTKEQKNFSSLVLSVLGLFFFSTLFVWADVGDVYYFETEKASIYGIKGKVGNLRPEKFKFTIKEKSVDFRGGKIIGDYSFITEKDGFGSSDLLFVGDQREVFSWVQNSWSIIASATFDGEIFKLTQNWWNGEVSIVFARCDKF